MLLFTSIYNQQYRKYSNMVWYFNFCSPHLTDDSQVNLNRTIMVVELVVAMLITFIVHMLAELYDEESSRIKNEADPPENLDKQGESNFQIHKNKERVNDQISLKSGTGLISKGSKTNEPGFFKNKKIFFLTVQTVENKSPCFLGHFGIAVAACAMYSPFIMQTLLGVAYIIVVIGILIFQAWKYERMLTISVGRLVTSAVVGVGLTNWDPFTINCFYTKLNM